ncbi:hypothetical protein [Lachnoclostridium phytofermentans]|uniref:hypothetical protein n=1 Tax=Lachnoclostridium phytofermentans TaxID=66219 RepID=UPI000497716A|nr:hypothetical protein [Lachnoclostridium phytofermentans]
MKKVFYIIGAGLVIGATVATAVYLLKNKKKKECGEDYDYKDSAEKRVATDDELSTEITPIHDDPGYEDVKSSAIGSMYSRHEGAATIMSDSVEAILENVKISKGTNDEIDEVSAELDKMLSED